MSDTTTTTATVSHAVGVNGGDSNHMPVKPKNVDQYLETTLLAWFVGFVLMWVVLWKLDVLPLGI